MPPAPPNPKSARHTAFTLIELVLVLSILAVIATLAAPRYALAIDEYRAEHAARRIAADISATQATARATAIAQTISFNPASNSYSMSPAAAGNSPPTVTLADAPFYSVLQSADFGGSATLTFNGFALPKSSGTVVVRCGAITRKIAVAPTSGAATVH
jgi:prepilin-type N-terminal cleavage/methylation domain-containing protein